MRYKVRETSAGSEYWDTQEKRTVFVKRGAKPDFEVVPEPENYVDAVNKELKAKTPEGKKEVETPEFGAMTIQQLQAYAQSVKVDVPKEITKRQDIIDYLTKQQEADDK